MTKKEVYDLIIIGGGPAGVTAAIYASRYKINALLISKDIGGQILEAHKIENYPGFNSISGIDLAKKFKEQLKYLNVEIKETNVDGIKKSEEGFIIGTSEEEKLEAKSLILTLGTERRKLTVPGEKEFLGKGVSYCAVCDAPFFKDKIVGIVGGGDSAASSAVLLSEHAKQVYILVKDNKMSANPDWIEQLNANKNIEIKYNTSVKEIKGEKTINSVVFEDNEELKLEGLFIEIGSTPATSLAKEIGVKINEQNYIAVDERQATNIKNVYAAGDITTGSNRFRQIATAVSEGAIALNSVYEDMKKKCLKKKKKD